MGNALCDKRCIDHFITSWNHHRVPGPSGCIPIKNMKATKRTAVIADFLIPSTPEAVLMYEQNIGCLNREVEFGRDPLVTLSDLYESRTFLVTSWGKLKGTFMQIRKPISSIPYLQK